MCGRYAALQDAGELAAIFEAEQIPVDAGSVDHAPNYKPNYKPNYNVTPSSEVFIVYDNDGSRCIDTAHWGLIPSWSKDTRGSSRMINARSETVADKPAYRAAFRRRRCLIPAAGYYEWQARTGAAKQPHFLHAVDGGILAFAGLYEDWVGPEGAIRSCTILTQSALGAVARIHDRMPVLVPAQEWTRWLDSSLQDADRVLSDLVGERSAEALSAYPVATLVNKPANNGPALVEPIEVTPPLFES